MSQLSLEAYIDLYFKNTPTRRKMIQRIALGDNPSAARIAKYARCEKKAVFEFLRAFTTSLILNRKERFNGITGDQISSETKLEKGMLEAVAWMRSFGYLNCVVRKKSKILKHAKSIGEIVPKRHRGVVQNDIPLKDLSKDKEKETNKEKAVWINPILEVKDLDRPAQLWAMQNASTHEMKEAIDSCRWKIQHGGKISNPSGYFIGTLRNKMKLRGYNL